MTALPYPRIVVWRGGQVVGEHALPAGAELVVGRSEGCGVVVGDSSVSRMHARLVSDEGGVHLEDLGSANGTYVDNVRVQGRVRLTHGQQVRVAQKAQTSPVVLRFEDPSAPLAAAIGADVDVGAATVAMRTYESGPLPVTSAAAAGEPATAEPPPMPPLPSPAPQRTSLASTTPMQGQAPVAMPRVHGSRRGLVVALVAIAALGALAAAAAGGWWWLRWQDSRRGTAQQAPARASGRAFGDAAPLPPPAATSPTAVASIVPAGALPPAAAAVEGTPSPAAEPTPAAAARPALAGKWTARLENLFYPEGDYVVTVRLDLQQRGNTLSGRGQAAIESAAMTFGVPAADATGSVGPGAPPKVRLQLPFGRPIGKLELEGVFENGALAGIYRSSLLEQPGTWQAARDGGG